MGGAGDTVNFDFAAAIDFTHNYTDYFNGVEIINSKIKEVHVMYSYWILSALKKDLL